MDVNLPKVREILRESLDYHAQFKDFIALVGAPVLVICKHLKKC